MIPPYPPEPRYEEVLEWLEAAMFETAIYDLIEEMRNKNA